MVVAPVIVALSLAVDRALGDPKSGYHPVAVLGRFISWWGQPAHYPAWLQRSAGIVLWLVTIGLFSFPFFFIERVASPLLLLLAGPFLLKVCVGWRSLEDHVRAVIDGLDEGLSKGRERVSMMVSRDTSLLDREHVLSAAYESMAENLVDSIIAPLFFFGVGELVGAGLACAAAYRAANTMDAMLGYRDDRVRLGWCAATADDILNYVPARITGALLVLSFWFSGRLRKALLVFHEDAGKRPGYNGGIPMSLIAGGCGVCFEKTGVYRIGKRERSLDTGGRCIVSAVNRTTLVFSALLIVALCLLRPLTNM